MLQDYKLGVRMLLKYPGLTIAGGLALAIAIGIGAGWYDLVGKVLWPTIPLPEGDRVVVRRRRQREVDHQAGHLFARRVPSWRFDGHRSGRRRRQYRPSVCRRRRNVPHGLGRLGDWPGARSSTPSTRRE